MAKPIQDASIRIKLHENSWGITQLVDKDKIPSVPVLKITKDNEVETFLKRDRVWRWWQKKDGEWEASISLETRRTNGFAWPWRMKWIKFDVIKDATGMMNKFNGQFQQGRSLQDSLIQPFSPRHLSLSPLPPEKNLLPPWDEAKTSPISPRAPFALHP